MKKLFSIFVLMLTMSSISEAKDNQSNSFSRATDELKQISVSELSWRLHLSGEVFIVSSDGEKLISDANESREWEFNGQSDTPIVSNWSFTQAGLPQMAIRHEWKLEKDGKINVLIQQYDGMERDNDEKVTLGKLLKEDRFILKDFAPINWVIPHGNKKIVVRFTPGIWPNDSAIDIKNLPMSFKRAILYDGTGKVWADQFDASATFLAIRTHLGTAYLSFTPFKGAKLIGEAKGFRIKFKDRGSKFFVQSETAIVPHGAKVNVYGFTDLNKKTPRFQSVHTITSDKEDEFVKRF